MLKAMKRLNKYQKKMQRSWDRKARENAYMWVDSSKDKWDKGEYYDKGLGEVFGHAISFLKKKNFNDQDLKNMRALDLGCGTGRLTIGLAKYFSSVDGVDISPEMIKVAERDNKEINNVRFFLNNGCDLRRFPDNHYNFVFSFLVFQHIPRRSIVINYLEEMHRILIPGGYIKIQVRGYPGNIPTGLSDWRYQGFDSFYIALSKKWKLPLLRAFRYNTVFGSFFKRKQLEKILKRIGYINVESFYKPDDKRYLWASAKKP